MSQLLEHLERLELLGEAAELWSQVVALSLDQVLLPPSAKPLPHLVLMHHLLLLVLQLLTLRVYLQACECLLDEVAT